MSEYEDLKNAWQAWADHPGPVTLKKFGQVSATPRAPPGHASGLGCRACAEFAGSFAAIRRGGKRVEM